MNHCSTNVHIFKLTTSYILPLRACWMTRPTLCDLCIHTNMDNSSELGLSGSVPDNCRGVKNKKTIHVSSYQQTVQELPRCSALVPVSCLFFFTNVRVLGKPPGVDLLSKYRRNLANVQVFSAQPGVQTLRRPGQVCTCPVSGRGPGMMH